MQNLIQTVQKACTRIHFLLHDITCPCLVVASDIMASELGYKVTTEQSESVT